MSLPSAADWFVALENVRAFYPEDIFPSDSSSPDAKAARMARLTCDNLERLARIAMRDRLERDDA